MSRNIDCNRLAEASSPYLLQHRNNPVHWMEWGTEALAKARKQNKPILLSIGYAACHWCHVMAHESFEDDKTAALMNQLFINIKVDREERPEIDQIYMEALHVMGQQGGWPLTMFLTPEGKAYWGGTYFPPEPRQGMPSFTSVLAAVAQAWQRQWETISESADQLEDIVRQSLLPQAPHGEQFREDDADQFVSESFSRLDLQYGGLSPHPKFPNEPLWETLWNNSLNNPQKSELKAQAITWLRSLCLGGIYDHLGGGIHRYAVDSRWLVPHFEKMLYDNALFLRSLSLACHDQAAANDRNLFRKRIEETIHFIRTEMYAEGAGLISSHDADSEGEDGRYYLWSEAETDRHLDTEDAALFKRIYDVSQAGNWEGSVILHRLHPHGFSADQFQTRSITAAEEERLSQMRTALLAVRNKRAAPGRDDKILTDWNGLAIRAIADCGFRLDRPEWLAFADLLFRNVSESVDSNGRLPHSIRRGRARFPALLGDLAAMINAAITLYAYTGDEFYSNSARKWLGHGIDYHQDGHGSYFLTASDAQDIPFRTYQDRDDAVPSASGQWLEALQRAALVFSDEDLQNRADLLARKLWGRVRKQPHGYASIINALMLHLEPRKLVISNESGELISIARNFPDAARIDMMGKDLDQPFSGPEKRPAAWLCNGPVCLPPVFDVQALESILAPEESG